MRKTPLNIDKRVLIALTITIVFLTKVSVSFFYLFSGGVLGEVFENLNYKCKTCELAQIEAANDFKDGKYIVVEWGLPSNVRHSLLIDSIFKAEYKINTIHAGCIRNEEIICYDKTMRMLLLNKYGKEMPGKVWSSRR